MATHSSVLAGESQGQGSLVGCRLRGRRSDLAVAATDIKPQKTGCMCLYKREIKPTKSWVSRYSLSKQCRVTNSWALIFPLVDSIQSDCLFNLTLFPSIMWTMVLIPHPCLASGSLHIPSLDYVSGKGYSSCCVSWDTSFLALVAQILSQIILSSSSFEVLVKKCSVSSLYIFNKHLKWRWWWYFWSRN